MTVRLKKSWFILRFSLLFAITYPLVVLIELRPYEDAVALMVSVFLSILSLAHGVSGNIIYVGETAFSVDPSCTGFVSVVLLLSMVFSVGLIDRKQQLKVFVYGSSFLLGWNVLRVFLLVIAGPFMEPAHFSLWMLSGAFILYFWYHGIIKECRVVLE